MFVDTSVIVAILAEEPDAADFATRIAASQTRYTSGLVILEAAMRLSTMLDLDPRRVEVGIRAMLDEADIALVPIDGAIASQAVSAFAVYGKGRGHPAQLILADCMSYACARSLGVALLFKGNDFSRTDIAIA